jgi:branched-chain amino acid transport system permease protein
MVAPILFLDPNMMQVILLYAVRGRGARRSRQSDRRGRRRPVCSASGSRWLGRYVGFVGDVLKLPAALLVILLVLLVKPNGLFGRVTVRRV